MAAAILEWKFGVAAVGEPDVGWLKVFSVAYPGFIGYATAGNRPGAEFLLACDRVAKGETTRDWLRL